MSKKSAIISTAVVLLLALVTAAFAFSHLTAGIRGTGRSVSGAAAHRLTESELAEIDTLIKNNYAVLHLYYLTGLPHLPGPYNQVPEDGYYEVDTAAAGGYSAYTSLAALNALVDGTFEPVKAAQIKNNPRSYGAVYADKGGRLAINAEFAPYTGYTVSWERSAYAIPEDGVGDGECYVDVKLQGADGSERVSSSLLKKYNGKWLLTELIS